MVLNHFISMCVCCMQCVNWYIFVIYHFNSVLIFSFAAPTVCRYECRAYRYSNIQELQLLLFCDFKKIHIFFLPNLILSSKIRRKKVKKSENFEKITQGIFFLLRFQAPSGVYIIIFDIHKNSWKLNIAQFTVHRSIMMNSPKNARNFEVFKVLQIQMEIILFFIHFPTKTLSIQPMNLCDKWCALQKQNNFHLRQNSSNANDYRLPIHWYMCDRVFNPCHKYSSIYRLLSIRTLFYICLKHFIDDRNLESASSVQSFLDLTTLKSIFGIWNLFFNQFDERVEWWWLSIGTCA